MHALFTDPKASQFPPLPVNQPVSRLENPLARLPSVQRRCVPSRSCGWLPGGARSSCSVPPQVWFRFRLRFRFGRGWRRVSCPIDELGDVLGAGGGPPDAGTDEDRGAVPGASWLYHRGWVAGGGDMVCCSVVLIDVVRCSVVPVVNVVAGWVLV